MAACSPTAAAAAAGASPPAAAAAVERATPPPLAEGGPTGADLGRPALAGCSLLRRPPGGGG